MGILGTVLALHLCLCLSFGKMPRALHCCRTMDIGDMILELAEELISVSLCKLAVNSKPLHCCSLGQT
jgi:hypothetical protein